MITIRSFRLVLLFLTIVTLSSSSFAQDSIMLRFSETITIAEIQDGIKTFAGDPFEGRGSGQPGIDMAADYLVNEFKSLGLASPLNCDQPYRQIFTLERNRWEEITLISGVDTLSKNEEVISIGSLEELNGSYPVVFAGYGIDSESYSDYTGLNVENAVVAYITGEPKDKQGRSLLSKSFIPMYDRNSFGKDSIAKAKGAVATVRIDPDNESADRMITMYSKFNIGNQYQMIDESKQSDGPGGALYMGPDNGAKTLNISTKQLMRLIKKLQRGKQASKMFDHTLSIKMVRGDNRTQCSNIAGLLPGTDLKDEIIIVTAHYDHLGKQNEDIYNGADDNASGTIAIIEVAEAFMKAMEEGYQPRRSILFLPVAAEELGLLGSRFYVSSPLYPLKHTVANLNMDMIGRHDDDRPEDDEPYVYIYISGNEGHPFELVNREAVEMMNLSVIPEFQYMSDTQIRGGSDHMSFRNAGIPVLYYFNGTHKDYHRPTDTWEKIDYEQMMQTTRLVFATVWMLANKE